MVPNHFCLFNYQENNTFPDATPANENNETKTNCSNNAFEVGPLSDQKLESNSVNQNDIQLRKMSSCSLNQDRVALNRQNAVFRFIEFLSYSKAEAHKIFLKAP